LSSARASMPAKAALHPRCQCRSLRCVSHPRLSHLSPCCHRCRVAHVVHAVAILLMRRARHSPATVSGVDMHGASIRWPFVRVRRAGADDRAGGQPVQALLRLVGAAGRTPQRRAQADRLCGIVLLWRLRRQAARLHNQPVVARPGLRPVDSGCVVRVRVKIMGLIIIRTD
jgi:hypothetical protein